MSEGYGAAFMFDGKPFHVLGYTSPEGIARAVVTDGEEVFAPVADDGGEWVAICDDCPTTRDDKYGCDRKREWEFKPDNTVPARQLAEDFAQRHHDLVGHKVIVVQRITYTFQVYHDEHGGYGYMLGLGDMGADR